ncbi:MAG: PAS domain-containing protein [Campylobacterales bacterium]|nr:PAS domain-containing protein [Campylobacterales bacterium]
MKYKYNNDSHEIDNSKLVDDINMFEIFEHSYHGIVLTNPNIEDNPIVYANCAFINLFKYQLEDIIGKNCRFLQNDDREQKAIEQIRVAIENKVPILTILRNYDKFGKLIYNELSINPIFDTKKEKVKYFLGIQKDVTKEQNILQQLKSMF